MNPQDQSLASVEPRATLLVPIGEIHDVLSAQSKVEQMIVQALKEGTDYGEIPGTKAKALMKAGAERLCFAYGLVPEYEITDQEIDHDRKNTYYKKQWVGNYGERRQELTAGESIGFYRYRVRCTVRDRQTGRVVGQGEGIASTLETKYVDRPRDSENTILKMAQKRAFVGAVLNVFALSDRFTEEFETGADPEAGKQQPRQILTYAAFWPAIRALPAEQKKAEDHCEKNGLKIQQLVSQFQVGGGEMNKIAFLDYVAAAVSAAKPKTEPEPKSEGKKKTKAEASIDAQAPINADPDTGEIIEAEIVEEGDGVASPPEEEDGSVTI